MQFPGSLPLVIALERDVHHKHWLWRCPREWVFNIAVTVYCVLCTRVDSSCAGRQRYAKKGKLDISVLSLTPELR